MARAHNFSAGPAVLPESVLLQLQKDIWEAGNSGMGILECSHRGAMFEGRLADTKDRLRRLLALSEDQEVLFMHGGARTQFFQWPMNVLRGGRATYLDTGIWAAGAIEDARRFGTVDVPFSSKASRYDHVPTANSWGELPAGTKYLHYTSNNTVAGTEFHYMPDVPEGVWRVCDMSSNFLSRPIDGSKFDMIYAGAQKNAGPSGVTIVVLRKSLLAEMDPNLPAMLRYGVAVENNSMYNTPSTFAIHTVGLVAQWIEETGGVAAMEARNIAKADRLYAALSKGGWQLPVRADSRSRMNVRFSTGTPEGDDAFVKAAKAAGLTELKGHRSIGGLRASIYNSQTTAAIDALVEFIGSYAPMHA